MITDVVGNETVFNSKEEFADKFGVKVSTIDMWLQGKCKPKSSFGIYFVYVNGVETLDFSKR